MSARVVVPVIIALATAIGGFLFYRRQNSHLGTNYGPPRGSSETRKNNRQCGICLKQMESNERIFLPCGHIFCSKCIKPLIKGTQTTCPDCRAEIFQ